MNRFGSFLIGAMLGGLFGSVVGILLAPASGPEMRERIIQYADQVKSDVRTTAQQKREELERELAMRRMPQSSNQP